MDVDELDDIIRFKYHRLSDGKKVGERAYIKEFAHGECLAEQYLRYS